MVQSTGRRLQEEDWQVAYLKNPSEKNEALRGVEGKFYVWVICGSLWVSCSVCMRDQVMLRGTYSRYFALALTLLLVLRWLKRLRVRSSIFLVTLMLTILW